MLDMLKTPSKIYPDLKPCCSRDCDFVCLGDFTTISYYLHHPPGLADIQLPGPLNHCMACHSGNTHLGQDFLPVLAELQAQEHAHLATFQQPTPPKPSNQTDE